MNAAGEGPLGEEAGPRIKCESGRSVIRSLSGGIFYQIISGSAADASRRGETMWVLAAVPKVKTQQLLLQALPWLIGLVFALVVLSWLILKLREWLNEDDGPAADSRMLLTHFREMQGEGDLSDEEFRLIKRKLAGGMASVKTPEPPQAAEPAKPVSSDSSDE